MATQLIRTRGKHQTFPDKIDSEPEVLPDRPVKLIRTTKHYVFSAASGFNDDNNARR